MKRDRSSSGKVTDRLRKSICSCLKSDSIVNASGAAQSLGYSVRTLQRLLLAEGTTFSETLEAVRRELATEMLTSSDMAVTEISDKLGYSSVANFSRAFHRWKGVSPSEFRSL